MKLPMKELIVIEPQNLMTVFTQENGIDPILKKLEDEVSKFVPDMTTKKGREEIASIAYRVAKSKTYIDDLGKDLTSEMKKQTGLVDASRKKAREFCDALKEKVRAPLTEWENKEKQRIENHQNAVSSIRTYGNVTVNGIKLNLEQMKERMSELDKMVIDSKYEEFQAVAMSAHFEAKESIKREIDERQRYEEEQAELLKLRQEKEAREKQEREERIAKEAADKAKKEAEELAELKLKQEREEKESQLRKIKEEADKKEADRLAEIKKREDAEKELILTKKKAQEDADRAEKERLASIEKAVAEEKEKQDKLKKQQEEEQRKRDEDLEHRKKINNEALDDLSKIIMDTDKEISSVDMAKEIIKMIAMGKIRNVKINY